MLTNRVCATWRARITCALVLAGVSACTGDARRDDTSKLDTAYAPDTAALVDTNVIPVSDSATTDSLAAVPAGPTGSLISPYATGADSATRALPWFVLRKRGAITELIATRIVIDTLVRPCNDTGPSVNPTAVNTEWMFMVANIPGLRAGAIQAAVVDTSTPPIRMAGDSISFAFRGERFVIRGAAMTDSTYSLVHDGKGGQQTLEGTIPIAQWWRIVWAGDLNRDGAPDVLIETSAPESLRYQHLYMSGALPPDGIWRAAAVEGHLGC